MESTTSTDTTAAKSAEVRASTVWNEFVWGILFTVAVLGTISGEFTALKYITLSAIVLLCVWVAQPEKVAPADVQLQLSVTDKYNSDIFTDVLDKDLHQSNYQVLTVETCDTDDVQDSSDAPLTQVDSIEGAVVLYRPFAYYLRLWLSCLPEEIIDRDWIKFPAPKPCDLVHEFGPHNVPARGQVQPPLFPYPAPHSPAAQPGYSSYATLQNAFDQDHDLGLDAAGNPKSLEVIQINEFLSITNITGVWVFHFPLDHTTVEYLFVEWIQDCHIWWCADYCVYFEFQEPTAEGLPCIPIYYYAEDSSKIPPHPPIWGEKYRKEGRRAAGPWWTEAWAECVSVAAFSGINLIEDSYNDEVVWLEEKISQYVRDDGFQNTFVQQEYMIDRYRSLLGDEECDRFLRKLQVSEAVRVIKEQFSQLAETKSIHWILETHHQFVLELREYIGEKLVRQFIDELLNDEQVRNLRQTLRKDVYYNGIARVNGSKEFAQLQGLVGDEMVVEFLHDLGDQAVQREKRNRIRVYQTREVIHYFNFARTYSALEAQEKFLYRVTGMLGRYRANAFFSRVDRGFAKPQCFPHTKVAAAHQSYRKTVRRYAKFHRAAIARAEYFALGVGILGAEETEEVFAILQDEDARPLTEDMRVNMRKYVRMLTGMPEPSLTAEEMQGLSPDEVASAIQKKSILRIEDYPGHFFDEAASAIGHDPVTILYEGLNEAKAKMELEEQLQAQQTTEALEEMQVVIGDAEEEWSENGPYAARESFGPQLLRLIDIHAPFSAQVREYFLMHVRDFAKEHSVDEALDLYRNVVDYLWKTDFGKPADDFWDELHELEDAQNLRVGEQGDQVEVPDAQMNPSSPPTEEEIRVAQETSIEVDNSGNAQEETSPNFSVSSESMHFSPASSTPPSGTPSGSPASPVSLESRSTPPPKLPRSNPYDMKVLWASLDDGPRNYEFSPPKFQSDWTMYSSTPSTPQSRTSSRSPASPIFSESRPPLLPELQLSDPFNMESLRVALKEEPRGYEFAPATFHYTTD